MKYALVIRNDENSFKVAEKIKSRLKLEYDEENPDYVISLGGDGTFLRAVHKYIDLIDHVVFFGLNSGCLGFYTDYTMDNVDGLIDALENNNFNVNSHSLIEYNYKNEIGYALNEITLLNQMIVQTVDVYVDDVLFETVRGTGLCVCTTSGSTAYNKSLGGPVVDPSLEAFILTEIAPINSNAYRALSSPLVLSSKHTLRLKCHTDSMFTADQFIMDMKSEEWLNINFSCKKIRFGKMDNTSFVKRVQKAFL